MALFRAKNKVPAPMRDNAEPRDPPPKRLETAHLRQPPDFIIIGTQRGGTTSLYRYLSEHPGIGSAWRKEVHYFDRHYEHDMDWYLAHFPKRGKFEMVGEASPFYLFHPEVPRRVRDTVADVKLIALLRDPIDRAYSQFQMTTRRGIESLSFEEAIEREPERLAGSDASGLAWRQFSYLTRGHYDEQLQRWFSLFPRERFLILKSEDFYTTPEPILHETQEFLGVDRASPEEFKPYHLTDYGAEMDPATRTRLREHFAPHNERLYELLGRDLGWERER